MRHTLMTLSPPHVASKWLWCLVVVANVSVMVFVDDFEVIITAVVVVVNVKLLLLFPLYFGWLLWSLLQESC